MGSKPDDIVSAVLSEIEYQFWPSLFQRLKFLHSNYKAIPGSNPSQGGGRNCLRQPLKSLREFTVHADVSL